ncbi:expressed unknown protein [Seminavis robusta]|uniref:Uncharacterized protein n=1 Tax=Seminavis robusta TaxID=568900 RepID=A0A9N8DHH9_9STRA|nr:expressed unknown protein [Seminavis robusta]|eukprot:Sro88_g046350.1 n/a (905) ;mRNA; r:19126-21923
MGKEGLNATIKAILRLPAVLCGLCDFKPDFSERFRTGQVNAISVLKQPTLQDVEKTLWDSATRREKKEWMKAYVVPPESDLKIDDAWIISHVTLFLFIRAIYGFSKDRCCRELSFCKIPQKSRKPETLPELENHWGKQINGDLSCAAAHPDDYSNAETFYHSDHPRKTRFAKSQRGNLHILIDNGVIQWAQNRVREEPELFEMTGLFLEALLQFTGNLPAMQCAVYRIALQLRTMITDSVDPGAFCLDMMGFLRQTDWPINPPQQSIDEARGAIAKALNVKVDNPKVTGAVGNDNSGGTNTTGPTKKKPSAVRTTTILDSRREGRTPTNNSISTSLKRSAFITRTQLAALSGGKVDGKRYSQNPLRVETPFQYCGGGAFGSKDEFLHHICIKEENNLPLPSSEDEDFIIYRFAKKDGQVQKDIRDLKLNISSQPPIPIFWEPTPTNKTQKGGSPVQYVGHWKAKNVKVEKFSYNNKLRCANIWFRFHRYDGRFDRIIQYAHDKPPWAIFPLPIDIDENGDNQDDENEADALQSQVQQQEGDSVGDGDDSDDRNAPEKNPDDISNQLRDGNLQTEDVVPDTAASATLHNQQNNYGGADDGKPAAAVEAHDSPNDTSEQNKDGEPPVKGEVDNMSEANNSPSEEDRRPSATAFALHNLPDVALEDDGDKKPAARETTCHNSTSRKRPPSASDGNERRRSSRRTLASSSEPRTRTGQEARRPNGNRKGNGSPRKAGTPECVEVIELDDSSDEEEGDQTPVAGSAEAGEPNARMPARPMPAGTERAADRSEEAATNVARMPTRDEPVARAPTMQFVKVSVVMDKNEGGAHVEFCVLLETGDASFENIRNAIGDQIELDFEYDFWVPKLGVSLRPNQERFDVRHFRARGSVGDGTIERPYQAFIKKTAK